MSATLRAVLDTNVILASQRSPSPESPGREILDRWQAGQFTFLLSADTLAEYAEKMLEHRIPESQIVRLLRLLARHGEMISIIYFHLRHYPVDADDIMFLLCALNGAATHLVSYDKHLLTLQEAYKDEISICRPVEFLTACRGT